MEGNILFILLLVGIVAYSIYNADPSEVVQDNSGADHDPNSGKVTTLHGIDMTKMPAELTGPGSVKWIMEQDTSLSKKGVKRRLAWEILRRWQELQASGDAATPTVEQQTA
jgi:hypothetical protein